MAGADVCRHPPHTSLLQPLDTLCCCVYPHLSSRRFDDVQADVANLRRELETCRNELRDKSVALTAAEAASRNGRLALSELEGLRDQLASEHQRPQ